MGSRDRPHREEKKKPKDSGQKGKVQPIQPLLEPPTNVEVWKPKRKPREETDEG